MAEEARRLDTQSTDLQRLIGQAIIDGILKPGEVALVVLNYAQAGGNYTQRGGGNHTQSGGGNYNQAPVIAPI